MFETLTAGETRMVSSVHGDQAGGDSDYFARPVSGTVKAAVVLDGQQAHIKILNSGFEFGTGFSADVFAGLAAVSNAYVVGSNVSSVTLP